MVPSKIIGGGVVGLSSVIYYLSGIPMGITNFSINAILLLIGYRILGGKFAINTLIGMGAASLFLIFFQQVLEVQNMEQFKFENMEMITKAILDRILHYSYLFNITGPSYRIKDKLDPRRKDMN